MKSDGADGKIWDFVVIGGGAAGFFGALSFAEAQPGASVLILEQSAQTLGKVRVSGGGRCNVTHDCREPKALVRHYPRGSKALLGPFHRFGPTETFIWFEKRGVALKTEHDGRVFPVTDSSLTIVGALLEEVKRYGVVIHTQFGVDKLIQPEEKGGNWIVEGGKGRIMARKILLATGSSPKMWDMVSNMGVKIEKPVPSLFTFRTSDARLVDLAGISVPAARVQVEGTQWVASGPLLITHKGLSGPAVLRLSAWGARELNEMGYFFELRVDWVGHGAAAVREKLMSFRGEHPKKMVMSHALVEIPGRLWARLCGAAGVGVDMRWGDLSNHLLGKMAGEISECRLEVEGKNTFKEEFVTCGGVSLSEMDFRTMGFKQFPNLYGAGEFLDVDGITGGFNFQAAWTTGWIAGQSAAGK